MKIEIEIADKVISDTVESGLYGGIRDWGRVIARSPDNLTLTIKDTYDDNGKTFSLTPESWPLAIHRMFSGIAHDGTTFTRRHFCDMISENADATTGNVLIQLACFGDIIYA